MAKSNAKAGLEATLKNLNSTYGVGTVGKSKDMESIEIEKRTSGSLILDNALGGGYPVGKIVEIYGPESSGKTTLAIHAMAEVQKAGGTAAIVDAEHAFDPMYAMNVGVDVDELVISQPENGEQALEITEALIKSGDVHLVVVDSVSALVPKKQLEGEHGDANVGLQARMMSQGLMKLIGVANENKCTVIFINQIRMKIGVMFGNPETTSGGNALKFYASQRLDVRKQKTEEKDGEKTANNIKVKVVKNKVAPPFRIAETQIQFGVGIVKELEILRLGVEIGVIEKSGGWHSYEGSKLGNGEANCVEALQGTPEIAEEIAEMIKMAIEENNKNHKKLVE